MANYPFSEGGGWQGLMSRKRPYTGIDWSGYVPQMNTPMSDPGLVAANARVASGTTIPQTSGKQGLSMKNMINAMSKMKSPTGMDFGKGSRNVGGARPSGGDPLTGLSATYPYTGVTKPSNEAIERLRKWGY